MADPLSISASIVALLQASGTLVQYLKSSKDANKDIQALKIEVINVRGLLFSLKDLIPDADSDGGSDGDSLLPVFESLGGQDGPLKQFEMTLGDLASKLKPKEGLRKTGQILSWHFKKDDIKSLIDTLERYKTLFSLALQNDHLNLSRMVSENILSLKQDTVQAKAAVLNLQMIEEDEHRQKVIKWFSSVDLSANHYAACKKREPSTGDWFIRSPEFTQWQNDPGSFIWLYGFAGSGKTVLCSTVIQETKQLVNADSKKVLVYFYFDFREKEKQNIPDFLCSLIAQVLNELPTLPDEIKILHQKNAFQKSPSDITALKRILWSILRGYGDVYIIADALDECTEREELLLVLSELADMNSDKLHILVTSRQERDILEALEPIVTRSISLGGSKIDRDIAVHVHSQVVQHPKLKRWPESVKSDIEEKLVANAQGMFRWVFCQLNALKTCRKESTLRERLTQLPKDLDETYDRILQNIMDEDADEAFAALQWLAYSERPLYLDELAEAIVIKPGKYSLESRDRLLDPYEVLHICSTLVVLDNKDMQGIDEDADLEAHDLEGDGEEHTRKVVNFAHFSVKEYLISDRIRNGPASRFAVSAHAAHAFIGMTCLSYLLAFDKDDCLADGQLEVYPLIEYAGRSWLDHIRFVDSDPAYSEQTSMLAFELLHSRPYAFLNWLRLSDPDWRERNYIGLPRLDYDFRDVGPPIYYASLLHLPMVVKALLANGADVNDRGGGMGHALHAALCPLRSRTEIRRVGGQLSHATTATNDPRPIIVQLLLDHGADIEAENVSGSSVLYVAVSNGQEELVRVLIGMGADVRTRRRHGMTALHNAALYGRGEIVRLLLEKGADIEAKDERDGRHRATVLCAVSRFGNTAMVQLLLERGADISATDDVGRTALLYATQDGRKDTVQLLLKKGAYLGAKDYAGRTALHYAAVNGDEEVIQLLVENGADISAKDAKGQTALHLAAIERRGEAVKLLIDRGADIKEEDNAGCTALQYASPRSSDPSVKVALKALSFIATDDGL